ncbi:MAG: flagellar motor protein MotB [Mangrovibacterium sp.]|jgi:chemotaxis protein MotB
MKRMKANNVIMIIGALTLLISSCKPFYQCGQQRPEKFKASKRVEAVINERDSLCETLELRENEISSLNNNVFNLNKTLADTKKKYSDLINENLTQAEEFNLAMKQKGDELAEKEELLLQREKALNELQTVIARQDSITRRLNDILRDALLGFQSDELSVEVKNGKVYVSMSDKLLFQSGSASIEEKGKEAIKVLADVLDKNKDIDILIEGHTDTIPIHTAVYKDNWDLSVARATSIVRILTNEYKITPTRLTASGKGEFSPKATNSTPEGRAVNRRTEIILSPKLDEIMQLLKTS